MTTLNIYCGIRSIGWNVIKENDVIAFGGKRVNVDFDSYYAFTAGLPVTKRIDRRIKRQMRRNLWRFKARRNNLIKLLNEDNIPIPAQQMNLNRRELNNLRHKACLEKIDSGRLGRVLLDLQAKRGYKSMRGVDDTGGSDYLKEIEKHENALKNFPTVGAYLNTLPTFKNVILRRETYENEFRRICDVQGIDYERYYRAIYYQRPLKKGKIGFCRLEPNRKVTHASNPIYQHFRILRDVNNIEIFDHENNSVYISEEYRKEFLNQALAGNDLTKAKCLKIMGVKKPSLYKWYCGKAIAGDYSKKIANVSNCYGLWQDMISATDNEKLSAILKQKYGLAGDDLMRVVDFDIKSLGYADYSEKAIKKLLPLMIDGKSLNESILDVYGVVNLSAGVTLRNLVLEQVFASCKSLVSAINAKYDIDELQIEIDPLLKMGNKARKARAISRRRSEKANTELNERIKESGAEPNEYNRKKLRLWDEMGGVCPYFPDEKIDISELFTEKYNLDHIVPKSKIFDFSEDNLVICPQHVNREKLRATGRDFVGENAAEYVKFVNSAKISERKRTLLLMQEDDIPTDYLSRNAGTDYNTRCFLSLHDNSRCIPNKIISMYAKSWYGNPFDENDVRQSVVKSFVMANMSGDTISYFDNIREHTRRQTSSGAYDLQCEIELPDMTNMPIYCPKIKFFRRTKHGYVSRFSLHKETVYGERKRHYRNAKGEEKEETMYKVRHPVGSLTANMVKNISDKAIQQIIASRFEKESKNFAASVENNPIIFNDRPVKSVSVNVSGSSLIPLHSSENGHTAKFSKYKRKIDFVYSSISHRLYIDNNGKKTVALIDAVRDLNTGSFENKGIHRGDRVIYNEGQYIVSGLSQGKVALRSVYTLLAEDSIAINKASEIEKITKAHIPQV